MSLIRSIRGSRLAAAIIGPLVLLSVLVTIAVVGHAWLLARDHSRVEAQRTGLLVARLLTQAAASHYSAAGLSDYLTLLADNPLVKDIVVAAGDPLTVIAASQPGEAGLPVRSLPDQALAAYVQDVAAGRIAGGATQSLFSGNLFGQRILLHAPAPGPAAPREAFIGIRLEPALLHALSLPITRAFFGWTVFGVTLAVAIFIAILRRRVLLPLAAIETAVERRRAGARDARVRLEARDELGDVAAAIDSAFDALDAQYAEIRKLATVAEGSRTGAVITAPDGAIEWANASFTRISGYTLDEIRGRRPAEFLHGPGTDQQRVRALWSALRAGQRTATELRHYARDGRPMVIAVDAYPVLDDAGNVTHCVLLGEDLTGSRTTRQEVIANAARFLRDLAFDLHDHVGGDLGGLAFRAKILAQRLQEAGHPEAAAARELTAALNATADRTRSLSRRLAPTSAEQGGLANAMERLCQSTRSYSGAAVTLRLDTLLPELDTWQANHVYLIAQEALRNAIRHGSATRLKVSLAGRDHALVLRVTSNQRPWDPASREDGLGMRIMRFRAETMNATLSIRVRPRGATQVRLVIPLAWSIAPHTAREPPA